MEQCPDLAEIEQVFDLIIDAGDWADELLDVILQPLIDAVRDALVRPVGILARGKGALQERFNVVKLLEFVGDAVGDADAYIRAADDLSKVETQQRFLYRRRHISYIALRYAVIFQQRLDIALDVREIEQILDIVVDAGDRADKLLDVAFQPVVDGIRKALVGAVAAGGVIPNEPGKGAEYERLNIVELLDLVQQRFFRRTRRSAERTFDRSIQLIAIGRIDQVAELRINVCDRIDNVIRITQNRVEDIAVAADGVGDGAHGVGDVIEILKAKGTDQKLLEPLFQRVRQTDVHVDAADGLAQVKILQAAEIHVRQLVIGVGQRLHFGHDIREVCQLFDIVVDRKHWRRQFLDEIRDLVIDGLAPIGALQLFGDGLQLVDGSRDLGHQVVDHLHQLAVVKIHRLPDDGENRRFADTRLLVFRHKERLLGDHVQHCVFILVRADIVDLDPILAHGQFAAQIELQDDAAVIHKSPVRIADAHIAGQAVVGDDALYVVKHVDLIPLASDDLFEIQVEVRRGFLTPHTAAGVICLNIGQIDRDVLGVRGKALLRADAGGVAGGPGAHGGQKDEICPTGVVKCLDLIAGARAVHCLKLCGKCGAGCGHHVLPGGRPRLADRHDRKSNADLLSGQDGVALARRRLLRRYRFFKRHRLGLAVAGHRYAVFVAENIARSVTLDKTQIIFQRHGDVDAVVLQAVLREVLDLNFDVKYPIVLVLVLVGGVDLHLGDGVGEGDGKDAGGVDNLAQAVDRAKIHGLAVRNLCIVSLTAPIERHGGVGGAVIIRIGREVQIRIDDAAAFLLTRNAFQRGFRSIRVRD